MRLLSWSTIVVVVDGRMGVSKGGRGEREGGGVFCWV